MEDLEVLDDSSNGFSGVGSVCIPGAASLSSLHQSQLWQGMGSSNEAILNSKVCNLSMCQRKVTWVPYFQSWGTKGL